MRAAKIREPEIGSIVGEEEIEVIRSALTAIRERAQVPSGLGA
jgi:hypothetical protein